VSHQPDDEKVRDSESRYVYVLQRYLSVNQWEVTT